MVTLVQGIEFEFKILIDLPFSVVKVFQYNSALQYCCLLYFY